MTRALMVKCIEVQLLKASNFPRAVKQLYMLCIPGIPSHKSRAKSNKPET